MTEGLRYPGVHRRERPHKPAVIMGGSGEVLTYAQLDAYAWQAARALRELGLGTGDHVAFLLENRLECPGLQWGAHYAGLFYTFVGTRLAPDEVAYIVEDSGAAVVLVSARTAPRNVEAIAALRNPPAILTVGDGVDGLQRFEDVLPRQAPEPFAGAVEGGDMLYSAGTTGRPKGVRLPATGKPLGTTLFVADLVERIIGMDGRSVFLATMPYYHGAPCRWVQAVTGVGGTAVILERFDAEKALAAIGEHRVTHSQWVPTMFVRLLRLPEAVRSRYDLSSHRVAIHTGAPCPAHVKRALIEWWGPILESYYSGTEGVGMAHCTAREWIARPGTVGKAVFGTISIRDDEGRELGPGEEGTVYFAGGGRGFSYHNDAEGTAAAYAADGIATLGDIGRVDEDGFLYLTDRKADMIISGGVNIYPQELEAVLQEHPKVEDVAVVGVPDEEYGEEVLAVVMPSGGLRGDERLEQALIAFCAERLGPVKRPRRVAFREEIPREPTGKLQRRKLRDAYMVAE